MLKEILNLIADKTTALSDPLLDKSCAVCNGQLTHGGIEFKKLFGTSTFNLNHEFKNMGASHVCSHCAVFFKRELWQEYCERNGLDAYFPAVEGKERTLANWFFFSHYFAENDHRIVKNRQDWREYLTNPPEPPFCFVISTICKKHLIFKSEMAYNRENYPIRFEDKIIYIDRELFKTCLEHFEGLYQMGLNKSSIRTGDYNSSALLKVDKAAFFEHENVIKQVRVKNAGYLAVCEFVGGKE
jgi:hypothetical protein